MEKMITIFTEVAVAAIVLFGLVGMSSGLMDAGTVGADGTVSGAGVIYSGIEGLIKDIFDAAKDAATQGM